MPRKLNHEKPQAEGKTLKLDLSEPERILPVAKALANPERISILRRLGQRSMHVQELAQSLDLPVSTTALHIRVLEDAGLIMSENLPASRGTMKLCSRRMDFFSVTLTEKPQSQGSSISLEMPIGAYSRAIDILPTCGLSNAHSAIGELDNPRSFYLPARLGAEIIWFRQGFLEYLFGLMHIESMDIHWLELSFEACSEAPMHRNPWKSDISVFINDQCLGIWTSPADLGGRRGRLNPQWWPDVSTQFGYLKTWRTDHTGTYLENIRVSDTTVKDLGLAAAPHIKVKIGIDEDAQNLGGMNLFGANFGDYPQGMVLRLGYTVP